MMTDKPESIDAYIAGFREDTQKKLQQVRETIQKAAPEATEKISYAMPTFYLNGNLIHFAGYKNHIGLYPAPVAVEAFKGELAGYRQAKGSVQFPLDKPMPLALIAKITKFRVAQMNENSNTKKK